uniref:Uncharacterized protein n=1 Tax=Cacopsylla melanoneura TaxID=428564 RepID=A0A8D9FD72_9HEMI
MENLFALKGRRRGERSLIKSRLHINTNISLLQRYIAGFRLPMTTCNLHRFNLIHLHVLIKTLRLSDHLMFRLKFQLPILWIHMKFFLLTPLSHPQPHQYIRLLYLDTLSVNEDLPKDTAMTPTEEGRDVVAKLLCTATPKRNEFSSTILLLELHKNDFLSKLTFNLFIHNSNLGNQCLN